MEAYFDLLDQKKEKLLPAPYKFKVKYAARLPFEILPHTLAVGELPEGIEPRLFDVYIYSMTRPFNRLPAPSSLVENADGSITVGTPVPLTEPECEVYGFEYARSGWTGALQEYRIRRNNGFAPTVAEQPVQQ